MSGFVIDGRVPIWVDVRAGEGPVAVIVHDIGAPPIDVLGADAPAFDAAAAHGPVLLPHLRGHGRSGTVRGGIYTLAEFATDVVRVLRRTDAPALLAGIGRGALVAAVAAAAAPTSVQALVLAPGDAAFPCGIEPREARLQLFCELTTHGPSQPPASARTPEPLDPADRDLLWASVPRPVVWIGCPHGAWTAGAPADRVMDVIGRPLDDALRLIVEVGRAD
ncbi:MAG: alpha/beta hydrolase [Acidimicrobiales bacterium]|nr:alpha/beta hydrolase [Acidimicrobiales bacterium]